MPKSASNDADYTWSARSNHIAIHWDFQTYLTKPVQTCAGLYKACTTCTIDTGMMCGHRGMARDVPSHSKVVAQVPDTFTFDLWPQEGERVRRCDPCKSDHIFEKSRNFWISLCVVCVVAPRRRATIWAARVVFSVRFRGTSTFHCVTISKHIPATPNYRAHLVINSKTRRAKSKNSGISKM